MSHDRGIAAFVAELPVSRRAAAWAAERHSGQERAVDGAPFVLHPLEVALLLQAVGCPDEVVAAGLLHDVVEKGGVTVEEVDARFGPTVAGIVEALSEDGAIAGYEERKGELRRRAEAGGDDVLAVFAADKIVKARELRLVAAADRLLAAEVACKRAHYVESLAILERRLPGHPFTDALRFELAAHLLMPALGWLRPVGTAVPVSS